MSNQPANFDATPNVGWLYNKHYFEGISAGADADNKKLVADNTAALLKQVLPVTAELPFPATPSPPLFAITLKTTYPGLVTGIGVKHETGKAEGELKLGCAFDHTTGLPYIAGSGVKGKLRSFFAHPAYLLDVVNAELRPVLSLTRDLKNEDIASLEQAIFDGKAATGNRLNPYRCDTFHDAFAVQTDLPNQRFLTDDSITHHRHPLKSPIPVQFLVVGPGVSFRFLFRLFDTPLAEDMVFSAEAKYQLFAYLLREHGVGAKTRVGYGQFA